MMERWPSLPSRIIPAGAGKRSSGRRRLAVCRDHPRGCGEKPPRMPPRPPRPGSSPRVRGKAPKSPSCRRSVRIIPAGAGKSALDTFIKGAFADHPRGCGEKSSCMGVPLYCLGSSPRVRGKVGEAETPPVPEGIIPAGAGKRDLRDDCLRDVGDHPRGCGEKGAGDLKDAASKGSSPRVRGKAKRLKCVRACQGIIPAGAGKRRRLSPVLLLGRDHPRGCGEKSQSFRRADHA